MCICILTASDIPRAALTAKTREQSTRCQPSWQSRNALLLSKAITEGAIIRSNIWQ